ncbi:MAG: efflux RND transporter periplasmic adaptor subunit [Sulfuricaulis sp.]
MRRHLPGCRAAAVMWIAWLAVSPVSFAADTAPPSVLVQVAPVARHSLKETVTAFGRVQPDPDQATSITLKRAGMVSLLSVRLGQRVKAGQALLQFDTAPDALMQFQQAEAAANFARSDVERVQRLFKEQLATREQLAAARRGLRDAEARLHAQREVGNDRVKQVIHAPFAGIIAQLSVSRGQRVPADTAAMLLASHDALVVPLGLEQEDAVRVRSGQAVALASVFRPGVRVASRVGDVHAMVNPQTHLVDVYVRVPKKAADGLVLGEAMRGVITLNEKQVLAVPRSAVLRDDRGAYVFIVRDGRAHRVDVGTGLQADGYVSVSGEIKEGDSAITVGNYELTDGMAVRETAP